MEKPFPMPAWAVRRYERVAVSPQCVATTPDGATHGVDGAGHLLAFGGAGSAALQSWGAALRPFVCSLGEDESILAVRSEAGLRFVRWPGLHTDGSYRELHAQAVGPISFGPVALSAHLVVVLAGVELVIYKDDGEREALRISRFLVADRQALCVARLDDSRFVAANTHIAVAQIATGAIISEWLAEKPVIALAAVDGGKRVVSSHADAATHMRLRVWSTATGSLQHVLDSGPGAVIYCATLADGMLVSWGCGHVVRFWDLRKAFCRRVIVGGGGVCVATCSDDRIAVVKPDGVVHVHVIPWRRRRLATLSWTAAWFRGEVG